MRFIRTIKITQGKITLPEVLRNMKELEAGEFLDVFEDEKSHDIILRRKKE